MAEAKSVYLSNDGSTPAISYSIIANPGGSGGSWKTSFGANGGNNKDVDPLFLMGIDACSDPSTTAGDFRLMGISPAIDVGDCSMYVVVNGAARFVAHGMNGNDSG